MYNQERHKEEVIKEQIERGLISLMNNTKWKKLVAAIENDLPFPPPYQRKDILAASPEGDSFDEDVLYHGDWVEGIHPFFSIEWVRVRPRYMKPQGRLLPPKVIDEEELFLDILQQHRIPYQLEVDSILVYGYASDTSKVKIGRETEHH